MISRDHKPREEYVKCINETAGDFTGHTRADRFEKGKQTIMLRTRAGWMGWDGVGEPSWVWQTPTTRPTVDLPSNEI
jgi:hypothetical protein